MQVIRYSMYILMELILILHYTKLLVASIMLHLIPWVPSNTILYHDFSNIEVLQDDESTRIKTLSEKN